MIHMRRTQGHRAGGTASSESLHLPGLAYRPLECAYLKDIELSVTVLSRRPR